MFYKHDALKNKYCELEQKLKIQKAIQRKRKRKYYVVNQNNCESDRESKDRLSHKTNDTDAGKRTDDNLDGRIDKFADQLQTEFYYRILLRFL